MAGKPLPRAIDVKLTALGPTWRLSGAAVTNFDAQLPEPQAQLAKDIGDRTFNKGLTLIHSYSFDSRLL